MIKAWKAIIETNGQTRGRTFSRLDQWETTFTSQNNQVIPAHAAQSPALLAGSRPRERKTIVETALVGIR